MTEFYVYLHRKGLDNKPFYVGKGKGRRAWVKSGRNERWNRTVAKHGLTVEILFDGLTEEESLAVEVDCILELRSFGYDLCNMTSGGEGTSGHAVSEETRLKISKAHKGRIKDEKWRENMSKSQKGRKLPAHRVEQMRKINLGKKQSEETKAKRAETLEKVGTCNDRSVYVFYSGSDVFIGTRKEFSEYTGLERRRFRTLFEGKRSKVSCGWSLLTVTQLIILKEYQNHDYCH